MPVARHARQVGFLAAALLVSAALFARPLRRRRPAPVRPAPAVRRGAPSAPSAGDLRALEQVHQFLANVTPGAVTVVARRSKRPDFSCTGAFVSRDGLVATCLHGVAHEDLASIEIRPHGREPVPASVVALDEKTDLAILKPARALRPGHVFAGRGLAEVKSGLKVVSLALPCRPFLAYSPGTVNGIYTAEALREVLAGRFTGGQGYQYIETNARIGRAASGGLLLDAAGRPLGVCALKVPGVKMGFAIEWRAVTDLAKRAASAKPLALETVRAAAGKDVPERLFGPATTSHPVRAAVLKHKWAMYCPKCGGRGYVMVTKYKAKNVRKPYTAVSGKRFVTRYRTVRVTVPVRVRVNCDRCRKALVHPEPAQTSAALREILEPMLAMDHNAWQALVAWQEAGDVLEHAALDHAGYGAALSSAAAEALAKPDAHLGEPVVFTGRVAEARTDQAALLYLVGVAGADRHALVLYRGKVSVLKGMPCCVAGRLCAVRGAAPLVVAAGVNMLHKPDASYEPVRPRVEPPKPKPLSRPGPTTPDSRLGAARMYLSAGLRDKGLSILREVIRKHPDSKAAEQARSMLAKMGLDE